ncbi:MAG TPA: ABC transporter permease [Gemmatimonadales bacterium]|jgi:predicted permease
MSRPSEELPLSQQKPVAEDVRQEIADHIERRTAELIGAGMNPTDARAEAERVFGDLQGVSAKCREITARSRKSRHRVERLDGLIQDLRFALRLLRRSPTFAAVAIITLALGVGANTAIFSLINGVFLRPLPYPRGDQLVHVVELHKQGWGHLSYSNFVDVRRESASFQGLASYFGDRTTFLGANEPFRAVGTYMTSDFFRVMGARAELGRLTVPSDHQFGAAPVAVISDRLWQNQFGGNRDLASLHLRGEFNMQVVGVMAPGFNFPDNSDLWLPMELEQMPPSRTAHNGDVIGRLKDGVTPAAAQQEVSGVLRHIGETAGLDFDAVGAKVTTLRADLTGSARVPLLLLLGASALLLLTACTNLASTLLARGAARAQELAVRTAIGAGRLRVMRQIFTESLVIAVLGCGAGLLLAQALLRAMTAVAPADLNLLHAAHLDLAVLGFTAAIALVTAILFGFLPALRLSDIDSGQLMRGARGAGTRRGQIWSALVAVEVALAVILLIGTGVLIRSFARVLSVDIGFDPAHVTTVAIDLPESNYPNVQQAVAFHDRTLALIRAIPGVEAAGVTNVLPVMGDNPNGGFEVEGKPPMSAGHRNTGYGVYRLASTGYFAAMGMKVVNGRDFAESDNSTGQVAAIVNQTFADKEWPGQNAIGKRIRPTGMDTSDPMPWATVIGVVHDVPGHGITAPAAETYYYSYRQLPFRARWLTAAVRSTMPPGELEQQLRHAITQVDPQVPAEFAPMASLVSSTIADQRFMILLLGLFASVALILAAVGIYGVVSYSVAQRTREIGIRIALGAAPRRVGRMVQFGAMRVVLLGTVLGVVGALGTTRLLQSMLYGTRATDPLAFGAVVLLLLATAWLASWGPARRSTTVDPIRAIRSE